MFYSNNNDEHLKRSIQNIKKDYDILLNSIDKQIKDNENKLETTERKPEILNNILTLTKEKQTLEKELLGTIEEIRKIHECEITKNPAEK